MSLDLNPEGSTFFALIYYSEPLWESAMQTAVLDVR